MAKRMILVDERIYNELWKRSPMENSKSQLHSRLHSQLDSTELPDDVKAKQHQKTLNRFLNLKQQIPEHQQGALNGMTEETPHQSLKSTNKKAIRKRRPIQWLEPARQSRRKHIKWSKYGDE